MNELNENGWTIYYGEYEGDIENGFKRKGIGVVYNYKNGVVYKIDHMNGETKIGYEVIEGNIMKQYVKKGSWIFSLQYEGGCIVNEGLFYYNGEGMFYKARNDYYKAIFDKGKEVRRLMSIKDDEMMIYDEEQTVVYKGGFGDGYVKKGRGWRYEYENRKLKRVFVCENGEDVYKWIEMNDNQMIEYNENRLTIYQGEYMIVDNNDVIRNGEGDLFDNNKILEYSGRWKKNKRE